MMKTTTRNALGIYMFLRNGDYYDYPYRQALSSALAVADQVVVCECYSDKDNTYEALLDIQKTTDKLKIVRHPWVTDFRELSTLGNYAATFLDTEFQWQLQADEVLHENSYEKIKRYIQTNLDVPDVTAIRVKYYHFLGNYSTEFDFCYRDLIRIARRNTGWFLVGDAAQLDGGNKNTVFDSDIYVYHYGKVHSGGVGWQKEWDFQQLYTDIGFPDKKMKEMEIKFGEQYCDYVYLFESAIKEGKVREFKGTHPKIMVDRIAKFQLEGWEQFQSKMKAGLKTLNKI